MPHTQAAGSRTESQPNAHTLRSTSTEAEGQQTGEHPLLPGLVGYHNAAVKLRRGEITYHEFLALTRGAKPNFPERLRMLVDTMVTGFFGMVGSHHHRR